MSWLFLIGFLKISISWYSFQQQNVVINTNIVRLTWISVKCSIMRPRNIIPIAVVNLTNCTVGRSLSPLIFVWITTQMSMSYWSVKLATNDIKNMTLYQNLLFKRRFFSIASSYSCLCFWLSLRAESAPRFLFWSLSCELFFISPKDLTSPYAELP